RVEQPVFFHAEDAGGSGQLSLAHLAERGQSGVFLRRAEPATLSPRGRDQVCLDALAGVTGQRPTGAECFIIGVGEDTEQSQRSSHASLLIAGCTLRIPQLSGSVVRLLAEPARWE